MTGDLMDILEETNEGRMSLLCHDFLRTKNYFTRHRLVQSMARIPGKENISIHMSYVKILRFYVEMFRFQLKHTRYNPDCTCMDD